MDWFKARVFEASTWRGVGGLLVALGLVSAGSVDAAWAVCMALVGLVEVIREEKK